MKSLVDEKCKPYEIYKRVWQVFRKACFSQKKKKKKKKKKKLFTNVLKMGLPLQAQAEKIGHGVETHWHQ